MDFEATEDPLKNSLTLTIVDEEDEEGGAGVDYRRIFKGKARKQFQKIPKRGEKDFEPDGTKKQQNLLQEGRDAMYTALSVDTGLKQGAACGVWIEEYEMTHVPQALSTGSWFQHIGIGGPSGNWLLPEETLLMVSSGRMELLDEDGFEMGLLGAWGVCIEPTGGVNKYLIYAQLRRAGYNVFRPGYLKDNPPPPLSNEAPQNSPSSQVVKASPLWQKPFEIYAIVVGIFFHISAFLATLLQHLPSWLVPQPHKPYDAIYASLPPIATFSDSSYNLSIPDPPAIAFEAWRPNPKWKKRSPGPPDFHICVVDGREPFPSLAQLEHLYNSVAQKHPLGGKSGKVVLAVVDKGVSNYMTLDDTLLSMSASEL